MYAPSRGIKRASFTGFMEKRYKENPIEIVKRLRMILLDLNKAIIPAMKMRKIKIPGGKKMDVNTFLAGNIMGCINDLQYTGDKA
jgi:hypothetical protein